MSPRLPGSRGSPEKDAPRNLTNGVCAEGLRKATVTRAFVWESVIGSGANHDGKLKVVCAKLRNQIEVCKARHDGVDEAELVRSTVGELYGVIRRQREIDLMLVQHFGDE
jgi:hypothetical protein